MSQLEEELALKNEIILGVNQFKQVTMQNDLLGLALNIQTLLVTPPNTYPSDPDFGVGISSYKFEYARQEDLNEISTKIKDQQAKYIPSNMIRDIKVEFLKHKDIGFYSLGIMILMSNNDSAIIVVDQNGKNGKIFSKIYF